MSSFRNILSTVLVILSAAIGGAGIFTETLAVDIYFSYPSYWFASLWTLIASIAVKSPIHKDGLY